jgi:AcrR family transcriptional regulator
VEISTRLFSEHGYDKTTVRMIAESMGVKSGSLYSHIAGKDEILTRIVMSVADDFSGSVATANAGDQPPEQRLRAMTQAHLRVLDRRQAAVTVYYDEWRKLGEDSRRGIAERRDQYTQMFIQVVQEGIVDGTFTPDIDPRDAVLVLLSACNWTYQWYSRDGQLTADQIADRYVDVVVAGLHQRRR